jgi:hypothetical protein
MKNEKVLNSKQLSKIELNLSILEYFAGSNIFQNKPYDAISKRDD